MVSKLQFDPARASASFAIERRVGNAIRTLFVCFVLSLFVPFSARAHGPFDHSSRLLVSSNELELVVMMGADATHEFFAKSGLPANIIAPLSPGPPQAPYNLPPDLLTKLFNLSIDGKALVP